MNRMEIQIRDPFVLTMKEKGRYYLYGTTDKNPWNSPGEGFDAYSSEDLEHWEGPFAVFRPEESFWGTHDFWAPEVHRYNGSFYMFATFIGSGRKRGTQILVSDSPLGPFVPIKNEAATPGAWQCLDGTLYVDEESKPWLVFCHEWVETNDGEICALPLRPDLGGPLGEPVLLFRASEAVWPRLLPRRDGSGTVDARVTDGPFLHRCTNGTLLMLWSSLGPSGYAMGYARSESATLDGPWIQSPEPLLKSDGGHGMVFRTLDDRTHITYHSPNKTPDERFHYAEIEEVSGGIRLAGPRTKG